MPANERLALAATRLFDQINSHSCSALNVFERSVVRLDARPGSALIQRLELLTQIAR